jgi:three-Cys-motif partner protein
MYAEIFAKGMKNRWKHRVYIDTCAGAGHALMREANRRIMTSPLLALTLSDPFTKYIFCEKDPALLQALERRVTSLAPAADVSFVEGDINKRVDEVVALLPRHSHGNTVLSFCFVDPFGLNIDFATIERLSTGRAMDFLILLALAMDANRNMKTYEKAESDVVGRWLGDAAWRSRWHAAKAGGIGSIRFLAQDYLMAMSRIGYVTSSIDQMIEVKTHHNNMRLYYLAFFSRSGLGYRFWNQVRKYYSEQLGLEI